MTDRYERIRQALAMGPTPGPWLVCPTNSGVFVKSERVSGYLAEVRHCRTTQDVKADAHLIAACDPDTIRALLEERDALREALKVLVKQQDKLDAARWRYIRRKLCLTGNGDGTCAMQAINLPAAIQGWPEPGQVAEFCDAAIDAAMRKEDSND